MFSVANGELGPLTDEPAPDPLFVAENERVSVLDGQGVLCTTHRPVSAAAAARCCSVGLSDSDWSFLRTASCHSFAMVGRLRCVRSMGVVDEQSRTLGQAQHERNVVQSHQLPPSHTPPQHRRS